MTSIYEKYGGYDFFHGCIYALYLEMFDHPEISYHFIGVNIDTLSKLQTCFLIRAIGGPDLYKGRDINLVHASMGITPFQFDEISKAFRLVFLSKGVARKDVDFIMDFVTSWRPQIVRAKTSPVDKIMKPFYRFVRKHLRNYLPRGSSWVRSGDDE